MIEIVKSENFDFEHYGYAICECTLLGEGIQIPRKEYNDFVSFNCPRCGKSLGLYVKGYKEWNQPIDTRWSSPVNPDCFKDCREDFYDNRREEKRSD